MRDLTINRIATSQPNVGASAHSRPHRRFDLVPEAGVLGRHGRGSVLTTDVLTRVPMADVLMPLVRQTCAGIRANAYWLHTPKFGTSDHFQRWRFAT